MTLDYMLTQLDLLLFTSHTMPWSCYWCSVGWLEIVILVFGRLILPNLDSLMNSWLLALCQIQEEGEEASPPPASFKRSGSIPWLDLGISLVPLPIMEECMMAMFDGYGIVKGNMHVWLSLALCIKFFLSGLVAANLRYHIFFILGRFYVKITGVYICTRRHSTCICSVVILIDWWTSICKKHFMPLQLKASNHVTIQESTPEQDLPTDWTLQLFQDSWIPQAAKTVEYQMDGWCDGDGWLVASFRYICA